MRSRRTSSDCVGEDKLLIHEVYRRVADKVKDAPPGHLSGLLAGINNGSGLSWVLNNRLDCGFGWEVSRFAFEFDSVLSEYGRLYGGAHRGFVVDSCRVFRVSTVYEAVCLMLKGVARCFPGITGISCECNDLYRFDYLLGGLIKLLLSAEACDDTRILAYYIGQQDAYDLLAGYCLNHVADRVVASAFRVGSAELDLTAGYDAIVHSRGSTSETSYADVMDVKSRLGAAYFRDPLSSRAFFDGINTKLILARKFLRTEILRVDMESLRSRVLALIVKNDVVVSNCAAAIGFIHSSMISKEESSRVLGYTSDCVSNGFYVPVCDITGVSLDLAEELRNAIEMRLMKSDGYVRFSGVRVSMGTEDRCQMLSVPMDNGNGIEEIRKIIADEIVNAKSKSRILSDVMGDSEGERVSDFFESPLLSVAHVTSSGSPTRHTLANHVSVKRALLTIGDRCFGDADLKEMRVVIHQMKPASLTYDSCMVCASSLLHTSEYAMSFRHPAQVPGLPLVTNQRGVVVDWYASDSRRNVVYSPASGEAVLPPIVSTFHPDTGRFVRAGLDYCGIFEESWLDDNAELLITDDLDWLGPGSMVLYTAARSIDGSWIVVQLSRCHSYLSAIYWRHHSGSTVMEIRIDAVVTLVNDAGYRLKAYLWNDAIGRIYVPVRACPASLTSGDMVNCIARYCYGQDWTRGEDIPWVAVTAERAPMVAADSNSVCDALTTSDGWICSFDYGHMRYSERLADLDSCGHFVTFDEMAIAVYGDGVYCRYGQLKHCVTGEVVFMDWNDIDPHVKFIGRGQQCSVTYVSLTGAGHNFKRAVFVVPSGCPFV